MSKNIKPQFKKELINKLSEYELKLLTKLTELSIDKTRSDSSNVQIYANILHVSQSGMSRKINFKVNFSDSTILTDITFLIAKIADYSTKNKFYSAVNVSGCGMDMIFSVLSNFSYCVLNYLENKDQVIAVLSDNGRQNYELFTDYRDL